MITNKYQGICFVNSEGWKNMEAYDELEPHLRHRLANSPFNLCPACVGMYGHESISEMENYVRWEGLT